MRASALIVLIAGSVLLTGCSAKDHHATSGSKAAIAVRIAVAQTQTVTQTLSLPGTVTRGRHARLASPYGGMVTATPAVIGTTVKAGQALLSVGLSNARARLADARAQATAALAQAKQAAIDEARFKALKQEGAVAPREYERVHERYIASRAQAQAAQQGLQSAERDMDYAEIRAPFDGLLTERPVKKGDYVQPGALLAEVVGGPAEVELHVSESTYKHLPLHTQVQVTVGAQTYPATVIESVDAADPMTRTHSIKLRIQGSSLPPFGSYATVHVPLGTQKSVTVPTGAVVDRAGLSGVFVVDKHDQAHFYPVLTAAGGNDGSTVVVSGLVAGERVVIDPPLSLGNNVSVKAVDQTHG